jgi:dihydroorotate dehydrogenase (NAD+) catalytic subunit
MVWQVANAVKIPVIGIGGISGANDAIEFMLAGATAIQVGTANFIDPAVTTKIVQGIKEYMLKHRLDNLSQITGQLITS